METWDDIRAERNNLLTDADHLINKMRDEGHYKLQEAIQYRVKLRNITDDYATPQEVVWPAAPEF